MQSVSMTFERSGSFTVVFSFITQNISLMLDLTEARKLPPPLACHLGITQVIGVWRAIE